jgi:hypothetical protein
MPLLYATPPEEGPQVCVPVKDDSSQDSSPTGGKAAECLGFLKGKCTYGEKCKFLHVGVDSKGNKRQVCLGFSKGRCTYASKCKFLHQIYDPQTNTRNEVCVAYTWRKCPNGIDCPLIRLGSRKQKQRPKPRDTPEEPARAAAYPAYPPVPPVPVRDGAVDPVDPNVLPNFFDLTGFDFSMLPNGFDLPGYPGGFAPQKPNGAQSKGMRSNDPFLADHQDFIKDLMLAGQNTHGYAKSNGFPPPGIDLSAALAAPHLKDARGMLPPPPAVSEQPEVAQVCMEVANVNARLLALFVDRRAWGLEILWAFMEMLGFGEKFDLLCPPCPAAPYAVVRFTNSTIAKSFVAKAFGAPLGGSEVTVGLPAMQSVQGMLRLSRSNGSVDGVDEEQRNVLMRLQNDIVMMTRSEAEGLFRLFT